MRLSLLLPLLALSGRATAQTDRALADRINRMERADQERRAQQVDLQNAGATPVALRKASDRVEATDSLHLPQLRAIVRHYGYPGFKLVGRQSSYHFWLLVQHADRAPKFQDSVLQLMKAAVDAGDALAENYAYLRDRVCMNLGKPQVYGTQARINAARTAFEPFPVADSAGLDARRKAVGLEPMADYLRGMNELYRGALRKTD